MSLTTHMHTHCLAVSLSMHQSLTHVRGIFNLFFFFWSCHIDMSAHVDVLSLSLPLSHSLTDTDADFNHFVSCQERNVSQPSSSLIPDVPSLVRLSLCLPSGSVQPLFHSFSISLSLLCLYLMHTLALLVPLSCLLKRGLLLLPTGAGWPWCPLFRCNTLLPAHSAVIIAIRPVCPIVATS